MLITEYSLVTLLHGCKKKNTKATPLVPITQKVMYAARE